MPRPPRMTSSPGPPKLANATVSNHAHSGNAAVRSDVVHREAAQTSAALTRPLTSALTGKGTEPMYSGSSKTRHHRRQDTVHGQQRQDDDTNRRVCRRGAVTRGDDRLGGSQDEMLSTCGRTEPTTH